MDSAFSSHPISRIPFRVAFPHDKSRLLPSQMVYPRTSLRLALTALLCLCAATSAHAQGTSDKIFLKGNPTPDVGQITGVQGDTILLNIPGGSTSRALALVDHVEAPAPPTYASGIAAYNVGNYDKALADLRGIGEKFRGLPVDWAQQTLAALGNIYLEKNDIAKAEAAFADFRKYYPKAPGNGLQFNVAQARIAFAKNNAVAAKQQLDAIIQAALKAPAEVNRTDGAAYAQAFYLMARLQERESNFQGALENYLRVVTLFYQDPAVAANAQKSADALRAAHKDVSVP